MFGIGERVWERWARSGEMDVFGKDARVQERWARLGEVDTFGRGERVRERGALRFLRVSRLLNLFASSYFLRQT